VDQATLDAWKAAYAQLADILIGFEQGLYKEAAVANGGWEGISSSLSVLPPFPSSFCVNENVGWRKFVVAKKIPESDEIISFYLEPVDHGKLPTYKPGKFFNFVQACPLHSLSCAPIRFFLPFLFFFLSLLIFKKLVNSSVRNELGCNFFL
jgi:hypothetical protein